MSELNSQSGTKTYLRLLGYVGWYWAAFSLAVLGLLIHTGAEIAFIDLLGYITDIVSQITGSTAGEKILIVAKNHNYFMVILDSRFSWLNKGSSISKGC